MNTTTLSTHLLGIKTLFLLNSSDFLINAMLTIFRAIFTKIHFVHGYLCGPLNNFLKAFPFSSSSIKKNKNFLCGKFIYIETILYLNRNYLTYTQKYAFTYVDRNMNIARGI